MLLLSPLVDLVKPRVMADKNRDRWNVFYSLPTGLGSWVDIIVSKHSGTSSYE